MLKTSKFATLTALVLLASQTVYAADNKSAAMVNGVSIPQASIDARVKMITMQGQPDSPDLRKMVREELINIELMKQEAVKQGLDKSPEVLQELELAKQSILARTFAQSVLKTRPIGDTQLRQEYDKAKAAMGDKEYNARHILVKSKEEASSIVSQLNQRMDFKKLAEKSIDAGSAKNGGSLGWSVPGNFVPPFADALRKLKKGEYTKDPVQSQFGWHVIQLDDVRDAKAPGFDEVKGQIQQSLQQQAIQKEVQALRAKAKVE